MKPVICYIGPLAIHGYGLMIGIGLLIAVSMAEASAPKKNLDKEEVFNLVFACIIGGLLGAKLLYWITIWEDIVANPKLLLDLAGGFVIYGCIIGAVIAAFIYCKVKKLNFLAYLDLIMPYAALAQAFGRIGCLLAGCCYGLETTSHFHVIFPTGSLAPAGVPLIPTQLIYSWANVVHFVLLYYLSKHQKFTGQVLGAYAINYSIGRYILEFFRGDLERGSVGVFSTSQFISLFIFVAGVALYYYSSKNRKQA